MQQHQELIQRIEEAEKVGSEAAMRLALDGESEEVEQQVYHFATICLDILGECRAALSSPSPMSEEQTEEKPAAVALGIERHQNEDSRNE